MKMLALEIRDRHTFIPALAIDMNPANEAQRYLLVRSGYPCAGPPVVVLTKMFGGYPANNEPYDWGDRTWRVAHQYILEHWDALRDGDVIDVEFILGETGKAKLSERYEAVA